MARSMMLIASFCAAGAGFAQVPLGPEFQVNSYTTGPQFEADISMAPDVFLDGFESGDTSAWSSTVP